MTTKEYIRFYVDGVLDWIDRIGYQLPPEFQIGVAAIRGYRSQRIKQASPSGTKSALPHSNGREQVQLLMRQQKRKALLILQKAAISHI